MGHEGDNREIFPIQGGCEHPLVQMAEVLSVTLRCGSISATMFKACSRPDDFGEVTFSPDDFFALREALGIVELALIGGGPAEEWERAGNREREAFQIWGWAKEAVPRLLEKRPLSDNEILEHLQLIKNSLTGFRRERRGPVEKVKEIGNFFTNLGSEGIFQCSQIQRNMGRWYGLQSTH